VIDESLACNGGVGAPTTWVTENHDLCRAATRYAVERPLKGREMPSEEQLDVRARHCCCLMLSTMLSITPLSFLPPPSLTISWAAAVHSRRCLPCAYAFASHIASLHHITSHHVRH
jgi:hypothetical protein